MEDELGVGVEVVDGFLVDLGGGQDEIQGNTWNNGGLLIERVVFATRSQGLVVETVSLLIRRADAVLWLWFGAYDQGAGKRETELIDFCPDFTG